MEHDNAKQAVLTTDDGAASIALGTMHFKESGRLLREALGDHDEVILNDVLAQRYIGCKLPEGKSISIHGVPGNDMACYMNGGTIEVFGNAQDQIGNTMNEGLVIVHGRCGDAAGYAMRGGKMFIRDGCGWRCGIHMKQFESKCPVLVVGGDAGQFLGEYMAGGIIVLMGKPGKYLASGMHGGAIYLMNPPEPDEIQEGLVLAKPEGEELEMLSVLLKEYNDHFESELPCPVDESGKDFYCLRPETSRPYVGLYVR